MKKTGKNHVVLLIDECHLIFPAGYKNDNIYAFFAYSRHLGLDIILLTQGIQSTSRMFNPLLEFVVKVTPRSRQVLNNFSFSYVSLTGHYLYSKSVAKRQIVFKAYKSFRVDEKSKPKNAIKHWAIIVVVIFCAAAFLFKSALAIVKGKGEAARQKQVAAERLRTAAAVPPPPPVPSPSPVAVVGAPPSLPLPPVPVMRSMSSVRFAPSSVPAASTAVKVSGVITNGPHKRFLLSDGRMIDSKRSLLVGDTFHR